MESAKLKGFKRYLKKIMKYVVMQHYQAMSLIVLHPMNSVMKGYNCDSSVIWLITYTFDDESVFGFFVGHPLTLLIEKHNF